MQRPNVAVMRDLLVKGWQVAKSAIGDFAPFVVGGLAVAIVGAKHGEDGSFFVGLVLMAVALACAENRGRDRGRADKVTSTTINMSIRLADGYAIVRDDAALIAQEADHG